MTKVLWFSRHTMTEEQLASLIRKVGEVDLVQIDKTINSAYELASEVAEADIIAIVAPINLQAQFVKLAGEKPVIISINDRVLTKTEDGSESKAEFVFKEWQRIISVDVVTEHFA